MAPAVRAAPPRQIRPDGDQTGAGGDDGTGCRPEGARVGGDGVGDESDLPDSELPPQGAWELGAQGLTEGAETGGADDGGAQPGDTGLRGQRPHHRHQLCHQMDGVDAPRTGAHRFP